MPALSPGTEAEAYRPLRPVFAEQLDAGQRPFNRPRCMASMRSDATPIRQHDPGHPLADANGDVWTAPGR